MGAFRCARRRLMVQGRLRRVERGQYYGYMVVDPLAEQDLLDLLDSLDPGVVHVSSQDGRQAALVAALAKVPSPVYVAESVWFDTGPLAALLAPKEAEWWGRLAKAIGRKGAPLAGLYTSPAHRLQVAVIWAAHDAKQARAKDPNWKARSGGWMWALTVKGKAPTNKSGKSILPGPAELAEEMERLAARDLPTLHDHLLGQVGGSGKPASGPETPEPEDLDALVDTLPHGDGYEEMDLELEQPTPLQAVR